MDRVTKEVRSRNMSRIRFKDTYPEKVVRRVLYDMGIHYRLHSKSLPGHPDIVLRLYGALIFVHGCFWHGHTCADGHTPKTNRRYWLAKLHQNVLRDRANKRKLVRAGWRVLVVWECQLRKPERVAAKIERFLGIPRTPY